MITTKAELLKSFLDFSWNFGNLFFVTSEPEPYEDESEQEFINKDRSNYQYFVWSDPDYNGDNSFIEVTYKDWNNEEQVCRGKGRHFVLDYCGPNIKVTFLPR